MAKENSDESDEQLAEQLSVASGKGLEDEVLRLLQKGANPNHSVWYPLHRACWNNRPYCAELLIKWGAKLKRKNFEKDIPLHKACEFNSMACVRLLLEHNSPTAIQSFPHTDVTNKWGQTPVNVARSKGHNKVADYIINYAKGYREEKTHMRLLDSMMRDKENTILLHYQKIYFIGSSGIGKSTTRKRLVHEITNLASLPEPQRKHLSTHLAESSQVLALMDEKEGKLTLKTSEDQDEETQMLISYILCCHTHSTDIPEHPEDESNHTSSTTSANAHVSTGTRVQPAANSKRHQEQVEATSNKIDKVVARLNSVKRLGPGKYGEYLQNKTLLNLIDVGGQPGFLEMLPFLSKGPGIFLAFFRLDKDLDEPCEVSYQRKDNKITPYKAIYTIRETLSQILSAINSHRASFDSARNEEYFAKMGHQVSLKSFAVLVGTFKDELIMQVKAEILFEKLQPEFPTISQSEIKQELISLSKNFPETDEASLSLPKLQKSIYEHLKNTFPMEAIIVNRLEKKLKEKKKAMEDVTSTFQDLLIHPRDEQFFAINNVHDKDADLDPLRTHLQSVLNHRFKEAKLRIHPSYLLLGTVLRREYDIVSIDDCNSIGKELNMTVEDVRFCMWFLDRWVGALIYCPEIEDDWFKENVICNPQVIFDSISSLVVDSLLKIHSSAYFSLKERSNWMEKGQFSLEMVNACHTKEHEKKLKHHKLIPVDKLVRFLEHCHLLSRIITKKQEVMYFIPAILECASPKELLKSPPPNTDTPSPVKISFESGHVPVGIFCAMISRLVSKGSDGILGMKWELVESGVKRNLIAFRVDTVEHIVTLVAHANCYEIRIIRQDRLISLYELCSYVLSTVLYVIKEINNDLSPIIAFDCKCGRHKSTSSNQLCKLTPGVITCFKCNHRRISLTADQECWFAEETAYGEYVSLVALPFASPDPSLSFNWIKKRPLSHNQNELVVEKVTRNHCEGYYTCEILKHGKPFFSTYHCLRVAGDTLISSNEKLFDDVRQATMELRSDWYSLSIELDIEYAMRKAIESDYRFVDVCFNAMLRHWVDRVSPPPTISALVEALTSPVINRGDIASEVETIPEVTGESDVSATPPDLDPQCLLEMDKHLKAVRRSLWDMRANWRDLGAELGITVGTLDMIESDDHRKTNYCLTHVLEHWLSQTPSPTLNKLVKALKLPAVGRGDIASNVEVLFTAY